MRKYLWLICLTLHAAPPPIDTNIVVLQEGGLIKIRASGVSMHHPISLTNSVQLFRVERTWTNSHPRTIIITKSQHETNQ